jgi:hypothetical protein
MKIRIFMRIIIFISLISPNFCLPQISNIAKCSPADFYRADINKNSQKITQFLDYRKLHIGRLLNERKIITDRIELMEKYGFGIQAIELIPKVQEIDRSIIKENEFTQKTYNKMFVEQSFLDVQFSNDPRRLSGVLSWHTGNQIDIQPRADCTYSIMSNGRQIINGLIGDDLLDYAKK